MLENFERAKYVIVHDEELVNLPYPGEESASMAIILSTWFTRSWTAAELWATRKKRNTVKVIFKGKDFNNPVPFLVNLDEMLHNTRFIMDETKSFPTLAYINASNIIKGLRSDVTDLRGLFHILRTRSTAWQKDRLMVAGMMAMRQNKFKGLISTLELTRDILLSYEEIPITAVFHGQMPMKRHGAWSWCPPVLFDLDDFWDLIPYSSYGKYAGANPEQISQEGVATANFMVLPIDAETGKVHPLGNHPAVIARISA